MPIDISLRQVTEQDLSTLFAHHQANHVEQRAPADYDAFAARWSRMLVDPNVKIKAILDGENLVGYISKFRRQDLPEVSYELSAPYWGKGFATAALNLFLREISTRPLYARAVKNNRASIRVLEKCGFSVVGEDRFIAPSGRQVEELIFALGL